MIRPEQIPDVIISLGLYPFAAAIQVERIAINMITITFPTTPVNVQLMNQLIWKALPQFFSTLPVRRIVENLLSSSVPAVISNSAGTQLCNFMMYKTLQLIDKMEWSVKAGFIHVPLLPEQVFELHIRPPNTPSLPIETMLGGIEAAIRTTLEGHFRADCCLYVLNVCGRAKA